MSRFVINVSEDIPDINAIDVVATVIRQGKISDDGKAYCYVTTFKDGIVVSVRKLKSGTHSFYVYREAPAPLSEGEGE